MIEDVKCAIRHLKAQADLYHIDPHKIGIYGGSAGGHLSSLVGLTDAEAGFDVGAYLEQTSRVQAVADLFGPADLTRNFSQTYSQLKSSVFGNFDLELASPPTYISADDPPFLILHGDRDRVVPLSQSQLLYDRLKEGHVPVELVVVQNGTHGFRTLDMVPSRRELTAMLVAFFTQHLK
jgi:acetyl esterase/lipase